MQVLHVPLVPSTSVLQTLPSILMQFAGNGGLEVIFVFFDLSLSISLKIILITQNFGNTVKYAYSEHAYNELMLTTK